jgi:hypothetical protein
MVIEADGVMGHLRKADAKRDKALMETSDIEYVLHITSTTSDLIMEELCLVLDNL